MKGDYSNQAAAVDVVSRKLGVYTSYTPLRRQQSCEMDDADPSEANFFTAENKGTTTALSSFSSFLMNPDFASNQTVAILPRGFGFMWSDVDAHHLMQLAYNLGHSENFVEGGKTYKKRFEDVIPLPDPTPPPASSVSRVNSGIVSWDTHAILKDDDGRREYGVGEMVSGLSGSDVGLIQQPFSILPSEDTGFPGACTDAPTALDEAKTKEIIVENIPYEYAVPMLTGWELGYSCHDEHVTELGAWIDDVHYDKAPGSPTGTLRYTFSSILRDEDGHPGHDYAHRVTILGLKPTVARQGAKATGARSSAYYSRRRAPGLKDEGKPESHRE